MTVREITHQPANDRELIIFYEAYDMGLQAGLGAARAAIDTELTQDMVTQTWLRMKAAQVRGIIERGLARAEARREEVDGKIKALIEREGENHERP